MEQITEAWAQYMDTLLSAGLNLSAQQAQQLSALAKELAGLHERQAIELRAWTTFWREYLPPMA
jgi:hypothetical protein